MLLIVTEKNTILALSLRRILLHEIYFIILFSLELKFASELFV